jgi:hypothetical protein
MSFGGPRVSFTNIYLGFASKKYYQTDSHAPKCLPRVTKTVMYIVILCQRLTKMFFTKSFHASDDTNWEHKYFLSEEGLFVSLA